MNVDDIVYYDEVRLNRLDRMDDDLKAHQHIDDSRILQNSRRHACPEQYKQIHRQKQDQENTKRINYDVDDGVHHHRLSHHRFLNCHLDRQHLVNKNQKWSPEKVKRERCVLLSVPVFDIPSPELVTEPPRDFPALPDVALPPFLPFRPRPP